MHCLSEKLISKILFSAKLHSSGIDFPYSTVVGTVTTINLGSAFEMPRVPRLAVPQFRDSIHVYMMAYSKLVDVWQKKYRSWGSVKLWVSVKSDVWQKKYRSLFDRTSLSNWNQHRCSVKSEVWQNLPKMSKIQIFYPKHLVLMGILKNPCDRIREFIFKKLCQKDFAIGPLFKVD